LALTPSSAAAASRPSLPIWLNELSSNPPVSEIMQGRKSDAPGVSPPSSGGVAQPASRRLLTPTTARPLSAVLREMILKVSSKVLVRQGLPDLLVFRLPKVTRALALAEARDPQRLPS